MTPALRAAVICLAALALVATGCGSDTKASNDYVKQVNKIQTDFLSDVQKVGNGASASTDPATAAKKTFSDLSGAIEKFIADLKNVDPPDKVKELHNRLISQMNQVDSEFKQAGSSIDSKDSKTILAAQTKLATSVSSLETQLSKTISDINSKLQG